MSAESIKSFPGFADKKGKRLGLGLGGKGEASFKLLRVPSLFERLILGESDGFEKYDIKKMERRAERLSDMDAIRARAERFGEETANELVQVIKFSLLIALGLALCIRKYYTGTCGQGEKQKVQQIQEREGHRRRGHRRGRGKRERRAGRGGGERGHGAGDSARTGGRRRGGGRPRDRRGRRGRASSIARRGRNQFGRSHSSARRAGIRAPRAPINCRSFRSRNNDEQSIFL